jgi:ComEC/Rec2-related protein
MSQSDVQNSPVRSRARPLVAFSMAFAAGILMAMFVPALFWLTLILCLVFGVHALRARNPRRLQVLICGLAILLGGGRYFAAMQRPSNDVALLPSTYVTLTGVVQSAVETTEDARTAASRSIRFQLAAQQVTVQTGEIGLTSRLLPVSGVIAVRLYLNSQTPAASVTQNPTHEPLPHYGDRISVHGHLEHPEGSRNPGGFDYGVFLARKEISASLLVRRAEEIHILEASGESGHPFLKLAYGLRQGVLAPSHRMLSPQQAGALNGILLGERGDLPGALSDSFERTGTSHILATAGLHVGMVVVLLLGLLRLCRIAPKPALGLTLLALGFYVVMAGGRPSVSRAVLMAAVYLVGLLLEREPDLPNALALAALILLLLNPHSLSDPGFQLSFATVITIVLLMPFAKGWIENLHKRIRGEGTGAKAARWTAEKVAVCFLLALASQLGSGPLVAYYFHTVSLISVVANTLVVPVIALIIALGFSAAALSAIPLLSHALYGPLSLLLTYVLVVVQTCAALPFAGFSIPSPSPLLIVLYYAGLWGTALYFQRKQRLAT